jgi:hypothetical protein
LYWKQHAHCLVHCLGPIQNRPVKTARVLKFKQYAGCFGAVLCTFAQYNAQKLNLCAAIPCPGQYCNEMGTLSALFSAMFYVIPPGRAGRITCNASGSHKTPLEDRCQGKINATHPGCSNRVYTIRHGTRPTSSSSPYSNSDQPRRALRKISKYNPMLDVQTMACSSHVVRGSWRFRF